MEIKKGIFFPLLIRYGKEEKAVNAWKDIIAIDDEKKRNEEVDKLVAVLEENRKSNGFWGKDDSIVVNVSEEFKLDDNEIYHLLFKNLKLVVEQNAEKREQTDPREFMVLAINKTVVDYFGLVNPEKIKEREDIVYTDSDDLGHGVSIKLQKGKETAVCSERSSVVHNSWLLFGETSYWCDSKDFYRGYGCEAHSFSIISIQKQKNGKMEKLSYIHDSALSIWAKLEEDWFEKVQNNEPIKALYRGNEIFYYGYYSSQKEFQLPPMSV